MSRKGGLRVVGRGEEGRRSGCGGRRGGKYEENVEEK